MRKTAGPHRPSDRPTSLPSLTSLASLTDRVGFLVVLERSDAITWLSLRNAPEVHIVAVDQLNTYDVLNSDDVVFTKGAYDAFVGGSSAPAKAETKPAAAEKPAAAKAEATTEDKATEATTEVKAFADVPADDASDAPTLPKGAKAPLKSGKAPKGYEIKGNADSGKYHEPDGQWYEQTEAEFYFKSVEDAEAAGFERAGGPKEDDK